jgi:hypothetical protein
MTRTLQECRGEVGILFTGDMHPSCATGGWHASIRRHVARACAIPSGVAGVCAAYAAYTPAESRCVMRLRIDAALAEHASSLGDSLVATRFADAQLAHEWLRSTGAFAEGDTTLVMEKRTHEMLSSRVLWDSVRSVDTATVNVDQSARAQARGLAHVRAYRTSAARTERIFASCFSSCPTEQVYDARTTHTYDRLLVFKCKPAAVRFDAGQLADRVRERVEEVFVRAFPGGCVVVDVGQRSGSWGITHTVCVAMRFAACTDERAIPEHLVGIATP